MSHLATRLSILCSFIGVGAFGVGVIAALLQGGFLAACFAIALLSGVAVMALDALSGVKRHTPVQAERFSRSLQPSH